MSQAQAYRQVTSTDIDLHLERLLEERLSEIVRSRRPGHCMRVSDLDNSLMLALARALSTNLGGAAHVHVLGRTHTDDPLLITSSKLIELRNPPSDGEQRPPLLVFVPNDLRTAAEDSFAEATFEQISVADAFSSLRDRLLDQLPDQYRSTVSDVLRFLSERAWRWADAAGAVRFLLSILINGPDREIVGASLCEIALVPDFRLLDDAAAVSYRLARNLSAVETLTFSNKSERSRILDLKLRDRVFRAKLSGYLAESDLEDPLRWSRRIVAERSLWFLSFDKWEFEEGAGVTPELRVDVLEVGLPIVPDNETDARLRELIGQQVLLVGKNGPKSFRVKFRCDPTPDSVPGLDHFKLQVISREAGSTAYAKKRLAWAGGRRDASVSFSNLANIDWENGWHFVRVIACTGDGDPIPILDAHGRPVPFGGSLDGTDFPNESDLFYVVKADDVEVEVPQRAVPKAASFDHALVQLWFKATGDNRNPEDATCTHRVWMDGGEREPKVEVLELKFAGEGLVHVPVSRILRIFEQRVLASPDEAPVWRLTISPSQTVDVAAEPSAWPELPSIRDFREARRELFNKLRGEDKQQLIESIDLYPFRDEVVRFAENYLFVLLSSLQVAESAEPDEQRRIISQIQRLLVLDAAFVDFTNHRGGHRSALLIGPMHPLRLLWIASWLTLAHQWLKQAQKRPSDFLSVTRDAVLQRLSLINFPALVPLGSGQLLSAVDNLHPFWSLYAPAGEGDPRGLLADVCTGIGLPEPNIGSFALDGHFLAQRVRRYLVQHPYVDTLVLNCFNAGRGRLLADILLELQRDREFCALRYNLRLFVTDPDAPGAGADLSELISPSSNLSAVEADAFATPTGNHLAPKLTFAVRDILEFRSSASEFPAHLSLLFDVFPAQTISASRPRTEDEGAPIHGLMQDFATNYIEDGDIVAWHRRPRHGFVSPIPEADEFSTLLVRLAETMSASAAAVATGQAGLTLRPVSTLVLAADQKALLHQVHDVSDWVFTIDKSLGIEFFDHHPASRRPEYLIDHSPNLSASSGRQVVITSRSQTEIRVLFERVLEDYGLSEFRNRAHGLLGELRALSGRLALKLASSTTHRAEALGLALAKMFLEFHDAFREQAVVPLDAHLDLFRALQKNPDELSDEISLRRTDLALFDLDCSSRVLTCSLVEVKCYHSAGDLGGLAQLKTSIADQIYQSERVLQYHFDPAVSGNVDRPDRVMKTHELVTILEFYVERAYRLRMLSYDAYEEAKYFLRTMESGYSLRFTRSALIFDFEKSGAEDFVEENGIEYHRIGTDRIRSLLEALPAKRSEDETHSVSPVRAAEEVLESDISSTMQLLSTKIPRLEHALFIPEKRTRTVSWESLSVSEFATSGGYREPVVPVHPRMEDKGPQSDETVPSEKNDSAVEQVVPETMQVETAAPSDDSISGNTGIPQLASHCAYDILLGVSGPSPQFGVLGKMMGRSVALDLNQTHTISLFGVQGGGKSYTLGSIIEMATLPINGINTLPRPLATVVFHYSQTQDYKPEFTSMNRANDDASAIQKLMAEYSASPAALREVVLLVPAGKLAARRAEYPDLEVLPLRFSSRELQAGHWRFLMGAVGNQATYIRKLNQVMRSMRENLTLSGLRDAIEQAGLPDNLNDLVKMRLELAGEYIDDTVTLTDVVRPGRLVIVDLRDEFIEKDEALGLFVVLLQLFGDATAAGVPFNKLVVFDEAHKYIGNPDLVEGLVSVIREMRHKGTSILVASQDPPSVPISVIELSSQIILHRFNSPAWLKHIQKANAALLGLTAEQLARLKAGEAYIWSAKATDQAFSREAQKVMMRPRATLHGGGTRTAV